MTASLRTIAYDTPFSLARTFASYIEDFPRKCRTRGNAEFLQFIFNISTMKNPTHNASIEEALTDLSVQEYPNILIIT